MAAFGGITYIAIQRPEGAWTRHVTPLTAVQETILALWGISPALYTRLAVPIQATVDSLPAVECAG